MGTHRSSLHNPREVGSSGGLAVHEDLQGSISGARYPASNDPTWANVTLDGFTLKLPGFAVDDFVDLHVETTHSAKLNDILDNHIHWLIESEDEGDEFQFQLTGVGAGMEETFQSIGTLKSGDRILGAAETGIHHVLGIGDIPAINTTASTVYFLRLTRIAVDDGNETTEPIYVFFDDSHIKIDTMGSLTEIHKV